MLWIRYEGHKRGGLERVAPVTLRIYPPHRRGNSFMKQPRIRVILLVFSSISISLMTLRFVACASCSRPGDPIGEQSGARVILTFVLAFISSALCGYLLAYFWDLALSRLMVASYKSILLWHFATMLVFLTTLSIFDLVAGNDVIWFSKLISVLAFVTYMEIKTYLKGSELIEGVWWKTYVVVIAAFCLDFPISRLFATVWLVRL